MKRILIILFSLISFAAFAQDTTYIQDQNHVYTGGGNEGNIFISTAGDVNIFQRNYLVSNSTGGTFNLIGRDDPDDGDTAQYDNSWVRGCYQESSTDGVHGFMDGYSAIGFKHNKSISVALTHVTEGAVTTAHGLTTPTMYNIYKFGSVYGFTVEGSDGKQIFNNTFASMEPMIGYALHFYYNNETPGNPWATNVDFKNNIGYIGERGDSVLLFLGTGCQATFEADYNIYYCEYTVDHQPYFYLQGHSPSVIDFAHWQSHGYDVHSRIQNPNFIDTIDFIPASPLTYGTDLGDFYDVGLDTSYTFVAGSYPDTVQQGTVWQVGAVLYSSEDIFHADYYVAPDGSDAAAGTLAAPWATLQKAIETAVAGDTVAFRGGTYTPTSYETGHDIFNYDVTAGNGNCGTSGNRIVYMNYPGEAPVFDFAEFGPSTSNVGLYMDSVHYVSFYGLTFKNLPKAASGPNAMTIDAHACSNLHFERIVIQDGGGAGFRYFSGIGDDLGITTDTTRWINCDAFNNVDSVGNHADGWKCDQDKGAYLYFEGNRAFFNSDDGFDVSGSALRVFKNNIAFGQGYVEGGNGNGFKTTGPRDSCSYSTLIFINNLSAYNHATDDGGFGFDFPSYKESEDPLDSAYFRPNARLYNNTAYKNDIGFAEVGENALFPFRNSVYRNNISYDALFVQDLTKIDVMILYYYYPESHNTWDYESGGFAFLTTDTVTVTDADFVSVDSTLAVSQMMAARGTDGSLPSFDFMKLASTSDLINKGTTYGWSEIESIVGSQVFSDTAPDIGFSEYTEGGGEPVTPYVRKYIKSNGKYLKSNGKFVVQ